MSNIEILGVIINNLTKTEILKKIQDFLHSNKNNYLVTINPEFLIQANKDPEFKNILNEADLKIVDGFGLVLASWLKGQNIKKRISGVDLTLEICKLAEQNNYSIFLLGGLGNTAQLVAENLNKQFPRLNIVGAEEGVILSLQSSILSPKSLSEENNELVGKIDRARPAILFVAFGHPKQEQWIKENLGKIPSIRLAMGVGGTFDYLAGKTPRAPHFMRNLGLEWLFRLIIEPWRVKRIYNAVFGFLWLVLKKDILKL